MSPVGHHVASQLRHLVWYNLDSNLPRNALFFAGRLHAYEPKSADAAHLIALCHLRLEQYSSAFDYSRPHGMRGTHLGCVYVFAQSCLALTKYSEGLVALERSKGLWAARSNWNKHTESRRQHLPDAAAVLCLQGKLLHAMQDLTKAMESYVEALKLNPFMWDAFLALSDLGANVKTQNIFKMAPEMIAALSTGMSQETPLGVLEDDPPPPPAVVPPSYLQPTGPNDPFSISTNRVNGDHRINLSKSALFEKLNGSTAVVTPIGVSTVGIEGLETPTGPAANVVSQAPRIKELSVPVIESSPTEPPHAPPAPLRKVRAMPAFGTDFSADAPPRMKTSMRAKSRANGEADDTDSAASTLAPTIGDRKRTVSGKTAESSAAGAQAGAGQDGLAQRRSVRLFNQITRPQSKFTLANANVTSREPREIKKVKATGARVRTTHSTVGRVVSGNRKHGDPMDLDSKEHRQAASTTASAAQAKSSPSEKVKEYEALQTLLELLMKLGSGYYALSNYRCQEAVNMFNSVTLAQKETPWVLAQMGRAHFENQAWVEAERYFARLRIIAPSRIEDMEVYSTILWHLKNEVDLAHLAHTLIGFDRLSPQAWCAVGNSFSLQREHDQALKCFKRATQLDPTFAYAFTLQGHEHVSNEEYDKAMAAYRCGIYADRRHYNAWYGVGKVYEKQGKFDVAEQQYRIALSINPTSAILICHVGMVLEKQKRPMQALELYARSVELNPRSTLALFKKARALTTLGYNEKALVVLRSLKDIAPDEANVHFLLGRVYKNLRQKQDAIRHFTTALNLDPKASHYIKEAMEQMEDDDDEDGMMAP